MTISNDKSQIMKLFMVAALLIPTPLLSSSLRSTYLYFIANILIFVVGAEAGLLSFFSTSPSALKPHSIIPTDAAPIEKGSSTTDKNIVGDDQEQIRMIKKSPSTIFFIDQPEVEDDDGDEGEEVGMGEVSGQELFQKAETFIGDFYKQLKMQREESWKKLHDFCHKAF